METTLNAMGALSATASARVRMNVSTTAKGQAQWDVTVEFSSLEETSTNLDAAINQVRQIIKAQGLTEAGAA